MKYLYKYPQRAYPYADIVTTNKNRGRDQPEYELMDAGVFDDDRYFDVFAEYAKNAAEDMLVRLTVHNRGPEDARLHLLPTLWFRNTWSWTPGVIKPELAALELAGHATVDVLHPSLARYYLICHDADNLLFTENESNNQRIFGTLNASRYVKDGINNYIVSGQVSAVNPERHGTKVAAHYKLYVPARGSVTVRLRLTTEAPAPSAKTRIPAPNQSRRNSATPPTLVNRVPAHARWM